MCVLNEAVEQIGGEEEAGEVVGRHVMGGLRPKVVVVMTPNRWGGAGVSGSLGGRWEGGGGGRNAEQAGAWGQRGGG